MSERITIYPSGDGWRWRYKASNGVIIGASTQGYSDKRDCIGNLERVTGGTVDVRYRHRTPSGRIYAQGYLFRRWGDTFVEILPDPPTDRSRPGLGTAGVTGAQPDEPASQAGRPVTGGGS